MAWAACTKPPRSPRFRLNKKGPASGGAFFCHLAGLPRWRSNAIELPDGTAGWLFPVRLTPSQPSPSGMIGCLGRSLKNILRSQDSRIPRLKRLFGAKRKRGLSSFLKRSRMLHEPPQGNITDDMPTKRSTQTFHILSLPESRYKKSGQPFTANRLFLLWCARRDSNSWPTGS